MCAQGLPAVQDYARNPAHHGNAGLCRDSCRHEKPAYRAREAGSNPLSRIVLANLPEFERWLKYPSDARPRPHPSVISAFEKFVECGVMRYGVVRYRCPGCGRDMLVAFSCKRRGLCPSCDAKRSAIITGAAMDRLLPLVPYRQWVLVVPKRLRYFINRSPALAGKVSKILAREINRYLVRKAAGAPAQLHFIQRFGGALNLHVHVHAVVSDGVFNLKPGFMGRPELAFTPVPMPTEEEFARIAAAIRRKVISQVRRYGGLPPEAAKNLLSWKNPGFSLHNGVGIRDWDRDALERLLGYCSRPAISLARLIYAARANMVLYHPEPNSVKQGLLTMTALEFLRRWGLLMPPPHKNLIHYYGALAPKSPLRPYLVAKVGRETGKSYIKERVKELSSGAKSWAACLARVFEVFPLICPKCHLEMKPVAIIMNDKELIRLLTHLELPTDFPIFKPAKALPAMNECGPPDENCQLDPREDLCEDNSQPADD